jgi:hypothetical protein
MDRDKGRKRGIYRKDRDREWERNVRSTSGMVDRETTKCCY